MCLMLEIKGSLTVICSLLYSTQQSKAAKTSHPLPCHLELHMPRWNRGYEPTAPLMFMFELKFSYKCKSIGTYG